MKIVYPEDAELKNEYASLTYGEFRGMFPKPAPAKLPRPERLIRYGYTEPRLLHYGIPGWRMPLRGGRQGKRVFRAGVRENPLFLRDGSQLFDGGNHRFACVVLPDLSRGLGTVDGKSGVQRGVSGENAL